LRAMMQTMKYNDTNQYSNFITFEGITRCFYMFQVFLDNIA
jgi:hypothetical protein